MPALGPPDEPSLFDVTSFDTSMRNRMNSLGIKVPAKATGQARQFHGWTGNKLDLFRLYLAVYKRVAGSGTYIDGFAGTGWVNIDGDRRPGTAQLALRSQAFKYYFMYEKPKNAKALQKYVDSTFKALKRSRIKIRPLDVNTALLADLDDELIARDKPCFAMLDQNATELSWATVERLASYKSYVPGDDPKHPLECKVEMWILVNTHQSLPRLIPKKFDSEYSTSPSAATMDRVFGSRSAWWDLTEGNLQPGQLAGRYARQLQEQLGYGCARSFLIWNPKNRAPQYYMVHASDHPSAHNFMSWAQGRNYHDKSETGRLPGMDHV